MLRAKALLLVPGILGLMACAVPPPTDPTLLALPPEGKEVLRCLAWVATISVWKHEIEFGCEQVNHGFEVAD
jgi:hypothetical protein